MTGPGLDPGKRSVYQAGAVMLGGWVVVVGVLLLAALVGTTSRPLELMMGPLLRPFIFSMVVVAALVSPVVAARLVGQHHARRWDLGRLETEGQATGTLTRRAVWQPSEPPTAAFTQWYVRVLYEIGDGILEWCMALVAPAAPMVERAPEFPVADNAVLNAAPPVPPSRRRRRGEVPDGGQAGGQERTGPLHPGGW